MVRRGKFDLLPSSPRLVAWRADPAIDVAGGLDSVRFETGLASQIDEQDRRRQAVVRPALQGGRHVGRILAVTARQHAAVYELEDNPGLFGGRGIVEQACQLVPQSSHLSVAIL